MARIWYFSTPHSAQNYTHIFLMTYFHTHYIKLLLHIRHSNVVHKYAYIVTLCIMHTSNTQPSAPKNTTAYLETYRNEWREVFIISAELYAFGAIVYLLLGSGQKQYWSDGWPSKLVQNDSIPVGSSPTIKQCHSIQVEAEKVRLIQAQPQSGTHYGDHSS